MSDEETNDAASLRAWVIAGCVAACVLVGSTWLVLNTMVSWEASLWYLNWKPGLYSMHEFVGSSLGGVMAAAFLLVGLASCIARRDPLAAITGGVGCALLIAASNDGTARWMAHASGLATEQCAVSFSRECVLNSFHRAYDLQRPLVGADASLASAYKQYVSLRETARFKPPSPHWNIAIAQRRQQHELATFATRFKKELDLALVAFKPLDRG